MFTVVMLLSVGYCTRFTARVYADENVTRHWCLRNREQFDSCRYERDATHRTLLLKEDVVRVMVSEKVLNRSLLCDSFPGVCKSGNIWRCIYQVIVLSSVFILSALSKKIAGSKTHARALFKRRNRFIDEIEDIKRWGNSIKPNVIVEQDWKIDWTSDIWLDCNNDVETSSTVLIHYKKTQVKTRDDNTYITNACRAVNNLPEICA